MQRFVYTPKVEAFIRCDGAGQGQIVDITEDIVDGSVVRNVDSMSTTTLTLQNKFGRYTGGARGTGGPNAVQIRPMDRIIIRMSRVSDPFLVFSGYIDEAPKFQLYPGTLTVAASCSLKLLANTYFDPGLPFMINYFKQYGWNYDPTSGALYDDITSGGGNKRFGYLDVAGGIGDVMRHILNDVGGFPLSAIDIDDLPTGFLQSISDAMNQDLTDDQQDTEQALARLRKFLGSTSSASPSTTDPNANPQTGTVAAEQAAQYALKAGFKGDAAIIAVAVAMAESSLKTDAENYNTNSTYDWGLWQINSVHAPGQSVGGVAPAPGSGLPTWATAFRSQMFDPALNAAQAYIISSQGTDFSPWFTYEGAPPHNGAYLKYKTIAQNAVQSAAISPNAPTPQSVNTAITQADTPRQSTDTGSTVASNLVKVVLNEASKNIVEQGGENFGPEILKYQQYVGISQGQPWCAAFASWALGQVGISNVKVSYVGNFSSFGSTVNDPHPGDLIHWGNEHVGVVVGRNGNTVNYVAGNQGDGVRHGSAPIGSVDPSFGVAATFIRITGVGNAADNIDLSQTNGSTGSVEDPTSAALQGGWAILQTQTNDSALSILLTGERAMQNDISLLNWIGQTCKASGRSFMSKPNGEFFAFYPDYFNYYTDTPYFRVSDIELVDFTVYENDTELVTHLFGVAPITSGEVAGMGQITTLDQQESKVASIEANAFKIFVNVDSAFNPYDFLSHYGARPLPKDYPEIGHPVLLWLATWMDFVQQWAKTWRAECSTTFLPELFPGTVVEIGQAGGVTMFVEQVTHSFSREGGFQTDASLVGLASKTDQPGMVRSGPIKDTRTQDSDYIDGGFTPQNLPNG